MDRIRGVYASDCIAQGLDRSARGGSTACSILACGGVDIDVLRNCVGRQGNGKGEGVVGMRSGGEVIRLFPGALQAFQRVLAGEPVVRVIPRKEAGRGGCEPEAADSVRGLVRPLRVMCHQRGGPLHVAERGR